MFELLGDLRNRLAAGLLVLRTDTLERTDNCVYFAYGNP